jgi:hypothetical protein
MKTIDLMPDKDSSLDATLQRARRALMEWGIVNASAVQLLDEEPHLGRIVLNHEAEKELALRVLTEGKFLIVRK